MKNPKQRLHDLGQLAKKHMGPHPSEEDLLDYVGEVLTETKMNEIRDHLIWCPACMERVAALDVDLDFEVDPNYKGAPIPKTGPAAAPPNQWRSWLTPLLAVAAVVMIAFTLSRETEGDRHSGALDVPLSATTRGSNPLTIEPEHSDLVLRLAVPAVPKQSFQLLLEDAQGKAVAQPRHGLKPNLGGRLVAIYSMPPPGAYRAVVVDAEGKRLEFNFSLRNP